MVSEKVVTFVRVVRKGPCEDILVREPNNEKQRTMYKLERSFQAQKRASSKALKQGGAQHVLVVGPANEVMVRGTTQIKEH